MDEKRIIVLKNFSIYQDQVVDLQTLIGNKKQSALIRELLDKHFKKLKKENVGKE